MKATAIPRIKFTKDVTLLDSRQKLAVDAKEKLGYGVLAKAIAIPGALLYNLNKLGINPLDARAVKKYQASKEKKGMWSGTKQFIISLSISTVAIAAFVAGMVGGWPYSRDIVWTPPHYAINTVNLIVALVFGVRAFAMVVNERIGHGNRKLIYWQTAAITNYPGIIPEFVLSKALEIKEALPKTEFTIEYLSRSDEHNPYVERLPDPFLIAHLDNERYYIEVWDEKEYENKL